MSQIIEVDFSAGAFKRPSIVFAYGYVNGPTVYVRDDRTLTLSLNGEILTADIFHRLPEASWSLVQQPGFEVIGRLQLNPRHLDLLVIDKGTGQLYAASALYSAIPRLTDTSRQFVSRHRHIAPVIHTQ
ncbi:hypothetical protein ACFRJ8_16290 [Arthrobacter sp. NPDC056886]|uniref:hypothetical protein n=1 Tax=Arthrobacter sp. NPDC056886 TaxID=3345960 RepID=UPI00366E7F32